MMYFTDAYTCYITDPEKIELSYVERYTWNPQLERHLRIKTDSDQFEVEIEPTQVEINEDSSGWQAMFVAAHQMVRKVKITLNRSDQLQLLYWTEDSDNARWRVHTKQEVCWDLGETAAAMARRWFEALKRLVADVPEKEEEKSHATHD